jgi:uncharacterized membrane protein YfhO
VVFTSSSGVHETEPPSDTEQTPEMCRVVSYACDEIAVDVQLDKPGFLVMSEINYPGWHAYVDGKATPLLTGNYLFRTLSLEPGRHHIRFVFNPFSFKAGTVVSFVSIVGVIVGLIVLNRQRRRL